MKRSRHSRGANYVSASDLAQMGVCERRMVLAARLGDRRTAHQLAAAARGTRAHRRFFREALRRNAGVETSEPKGPCFIATAVYGQGHETEVLRSFRDRVLRPCRTGRWLIGVYYRLSPALAHWLVLHPLAAAAVGVALRPVVASALWWVNKAGRKL
jgi:hypothetical protein